MLTALKIMVLWVMFSGLLALGLGSFIAQAQTPDLPKTIKLHNNATGQTIGTITMSGGHAYLRDKDGVHISTIVRNPDGSTTTFDPHGNIIEPVKD